MFVTYIHEKFHTPVPVLHSYRHQTEFQAAFILLYMLQKKKKSLERKSRIVSNM
jgi:hypothetical protein